MNALKLKESLEHIEESMSTIAPHRKPELFNEFLIQGYSALCLNTVPSSLTSETLRAKLCLGSLITLYDDFADRADMANPELLEMLYLLNFKNMTPDKCSQLYPHNVLGFAQSLFLEMRCILKSLPNYSSLLDLLNFDLMQFYNANQYSSLLTANPEIHSSFENSLYGHHNMGMVMASTMDLMALPNFDPRELGAIREVFLLGQRMGRIFNILATHKRETAEEDVTSELPQNLNALSLARAKNKLKRKVTNIKKSILCRKNKIHSFSVEKYIVGLEQIETLHKKMEGRI